MFRKIMLTAKDAEAKYGPFNLRLGIPTINPANTLIKPPMNIAKSHGTPKKLIEMAQV